MIEKQFKFKRFDVDIANIDEIALYEIDNNQSDDLDESNLFYVYSITDANVQDIVDKLNEKEKRIKTLTEENGQLKKENKHLRCTIESNSQDDYIDFLEKQNEKLKERIEELVSNDKIVFMVNE